MIRMELLPKVCPNCGHEKLRVMKDEGKTLGYFCSWCKATYDVTYEVDFPKKKVSFIGLLRNPEYISQLSVDLGDNLQKNLELEQQGIPFHSRAFVIEEFDISE